MDSTIANAGEELAEATLLAAARSGDADAFSALVTRHRSLIWSVCLRITGNAYDAEDALQDALLQIWRALGTFQGHSAFSTWAYRIATNASLRVIKRRQDTGELSEDQRTDRDFAEAVAAADLVQQALRQMPEQFRVALVLFELCDFSYEQIADYQQVGIQTVKSRIHRGRRALAEATRESR